MEKNERDSLRGKGKLVFPSRKKRKKELHKFYVGGTLRIKSYLFEIYKLTPERLKLKLIKKIDENSDKFSINEKLVVEGWNFKVLKKKRGGKIVLRVLPTER